MHAIEVVEIKKREQKERGGIRGEQRAYSRWGGEKEEMGLSLSLGSEGSGILKTGYGGKRRVPADVSHEFGSCARLNGKCPEHVRSTLFDGGICVYGS